MKNIHLWIILYRKFIPSVQNQYGDFCKEV